MERVRASILETVLVMIKLVMFLLVELLKHSDSRNVKTVKTVRKQITAKKATLNKTLRDKSPALAALKTWPAASKKQ